MKIRIALSSSGGELDATTIDVADTADAETRSIAIIEALAMWTLDAGDNITVSEEA